MKQYIISSAFAVFLLTVAGCTTYKSQSEDMIAAWEAGNGFSAATEVSNRVDRAAGKKDELLWRLEQGTILSTVGAYEESLKAFDMAEGLVDKYEEEAKVKVGSETAALLTNQANIPYTGRSYDKIMINTLKALDYLALGDVERARVEINRSLQRQQDAVAENSKRIEKAQEAANEAKEGNLENESGESQPSYDVDRAQNDERFAAAATAQLSEVDARLLSYTDYVNPFSVFIDGLFHSCLGVDNSDLERARKSFERVKGMSPGKNISADYEMVADMEDGNSEGAITYVFFATGSAPSRDQIRLDIPLFLVTDEVSYVGAAFPKLVYHDNFIKDINVVTADGDKYGNELLCDMDAVISQDFKNDWPVVVTKTLLTSGTKALVGQMAEKVAEENGNRWVHLATKVGNIAYQASTNIADTRTWRTLPKQISYIRLPTPENGSLTLEIGPLRKPVSVSSGKTNIVMVRSINAFAQPFISQFALN